MQVKHIYKSSQTYLVKSMYVLHFKNKFHLISVTYIYRFLSIIE